MTISHVFCKNSHTENGQIQQMRFQPCPKRQILDSSKLKEFANNNFKFYENGREFSKRVENTVARREIACYEHFLLFSQCYQKSCITDT